MVEEIIKGRQPFRPLLTLFHPKKQPLAQFPQISQLLLQHLMDVKWGWVEGLKVWQDSPGASPATFFMASHPSSSHPL